MLRIGFGYDIHPLIEQRQLILGGEEIPSNLGLLGHSDADVLLHALCDALLGACGEGDIGKHFPNTDPQFKGISSLVLLQRINLLLKEKNYHINNLDLMIIAEKPKLISYFPKIINNIARALKIDEDQVNIKATTNEGLGTIGRGEGIAAYAVALLTKKENKNDQ